MMGLKRKIRGKRHDVVIINGRVHYFSPTEVKRARKRFKKQEKDAHFAKIHGWK